MKRLFFSIGIMVSSLQSGAQQDYFVFIQDVSRQPFYVRIGENNHSSSAGGHLILSPMRDSVYSLFVGFPGDRYPEQLFTVNIDGRDRGFELKNINGGWELFDLQALQLLKPASTGKRSGRSVKKDDSYSRLMAGVVDDSTVLYTYIPDPVVKQDAAPGKAVNIAKPKGAEAGKPASMVLSESNPVKKIDTITASVANKKVASSVIPEIVGMEAGEEKHQQALKVPPKKAVAYDKRDIIRYGTENLREGKLFIYLDRSSAEIDTIRLIIPRL